jgi:hypothetical protein
MRTFAQAAVLAVAISAPVLTGGLVDPSVVSVLGKSGGCSSNCAVGGAGNGGASSNGAAQGGHTKTTQPGMGSASMSGTAAVGGTTGRIAINNPTFAIGSASGNFTTVPGKGHCTGALTGLCSTGP